MFRKFAAILLALTVLLSLALPVTAKDYDEEYIYYECYTLYPDFVNNVKACGATDAGIVTFIGSVESRLNELAIELTEENFDDCMFEAVNYALELRKNKAVKKALTNAYPDAVAEATKGRIPDEYMPIYNTIKRIVFGITDPIITLSGDRTCLSVNYINMPEDTSIFVAFYDAEGNLIHAHVNPTAALECDCENVGYATAFAFGSASLVPLCETFTLEF